jgi:hypothetical protein
MSHVSTPDPFDPKSLRINQAGVPSFGTRKLLTTVPVRKPGRQTFVRVHPSEQYRLDTAVIELKVDGEIYLVRPHLHDNLAEEITPVTLLTTMDRQSNVFFWYVKLPKDGRANEWHASAMTAAEKATKSWVRVVPNMALGAYDVHVAIADLGEPEWPTLSMRDMLQIAFRDRYIEDFDHPVITKLQGRS